MAVKLDEIRKAAERVAASHGLDLVDLEFTGPAKDRILRVTLEKQGLDLKSTKRVLDQPSAIFFLLCLPRGLQLLSHVFQDCTLLLGRIYLLTCIFRLSLLQFGSLAHLSRPVNHCH